MLRNPRQTAAGEFRNTTTFGMQLVTFRKQVAVTITAITLLAGAAEARADGPRSPGSGGARLTGFAPTGRVPPAEPVTPAAPGVAVVPVVRVVRVARSAPVAPVRVVPVAPSAPAATAPVPPVAPSAPVAAPT